MAKEQIWVLGNEVEGADRCIKWDLGNIGNFADCDKLIVDMTTLRESSLYFVKWEKATEIFDQIKKRFQSGGKIICILQPKFECTNSEKTIMNSYFWCPIFFDFKKVTQGKTIPPVKDFEFDNYMNKVKNWDIEIENPKYKNYPSDNTFDGSRVSASTSIYTQSYSLIGGIFEITGLLDFTRGKLTMLPPIDDSKEGIYSILKSWGRITSTPSPDWISQVDIPGLTEIEEKILSSKDEINKIKSTISELESKKQEKAKFKKLIFTDGVELEKIVKESLQMIGLQNVREGPDRNSEDLLFDFQMDGINLATIEVKGSKANVTQDHLRQAVDWAMKNEIEGKKVKAILIPNTHRLDDYNISKNKRLDFHDFEDFCKTRDLCIFPTACVFDLVYAKLDGKSINITKLEELIVDTKGVLKDITSVLG